MTETGLSGLMASTKVCTISDIAPGHMAAFFVDGWEVVVVRDSSGTFRAYDGICPHEDYPLVDGELDDDVLMCAGHAWCFDVTNGKCINQPSFTLAQYQVDIRDSELFVDRVRIDAVD